MTRLSVLKICNNVYVSLFAVINFAKNQLLYCMKKVLLTSLHDIRVMGWSITWVFDPI